MDDWMYGCMDACMHIYVYICIYCLMLGPVSFNPSATESKKPKAAGAGKQTAAASATTAAKKPTSKV